MQLSDYLENTIGLASWKKGLGLFLLAATIPFLKYVLSWFMLQDAVESVSGDHSTLPDWQLNCKSFPCL